MRDKSIQGRVSEWAAYRAQGISNQEIAEKLGISTHTLRSYIHRAFKDGWLRIDNPSERLEFVLAPKIVDNLEYFLDAKDRTVTIEGAKGIGLFKSHQAVRVESDSPQSILALNIEVSGESRRGGGNIVGVPRVIDVKAREKPLEP